jgi:hypothetical protein
VSATETAPVARGTRLELLQRSLAEKRRELEHLRLLVHDSFQAEEDARLNELRAEPTRSAEKVGGLVQKIRTTRGKNAARAEALERHISSLERLEEEYRQDALEQTVAEETNRAQELVATEKAAWKAFGQKYIELFALWDEALRPALEARDSHVVDVEARQPRLLESETWAMTSAPYVCPVPTTLFAALSMVHEAACDPAGRGLRQEGGARSDDNRVLVEIVPDLRSQNRAALLSGKTPTRTGSGSSGGPEIIRAERQDGLTDWHSRR